jgi:hypothetical protein
LGSLNVYKFGLRERRDNKHEKRCQYRICQTIMMTNEPKKSLILQYEKPELEGYAYT